MMNYSMVSPLSLNIFESGNLGLFAKCDYILPYK